jgi:hypothetical protein
VLEGRTPAIHCLASSRGEMFCRIGWGPLMGCPTVCMKGVPALRRWNPNGADRKEAIPPPPRDSRWSCPPAVQQAAVRIDIQSPITSTAFL